MNRQDHQLRFQAAIITHTAWSLVGTFCFIALAAVVCAIFAGAAP